MFDVIIKGAHIIDGTGNPWFESDIGIYNGKIETIQRLPAARASKAINARGLIVSPGFIDAHSHSDRTLLADSSPDSTVRQGVTTEIVGNCGFSDAPIFSKNKNLIMKRVRTYVPKVDVDWKNFGEYLERVGKHGIPRNVACLVGHNTIREGVIGLEDRKATKNELEKMKNLLKEALEAGALGFSTGLEFLPGRASDLEELIELVKVVSKYNRIYVTHMRNRDEFFEQSMEEQIKIGFATGVNLEISHLNVKTGASEGSWDRVVCQMEKAREKGLDVTADCIPYDWGPGMMTTILPNWIFKDGLNQAIKWLQDPEIRNKLKSQCDRYWRFIHKGEWDRVTLSKNTRNTDLIGKTFEEIAQIRSKNPWDCFFDILVDEEKDMEDTMMNGRLFSEEHVRAKLSHPLFMFAADGAASNKVGSCISFNHPNAYGWVPRILGHYVREVKLFSLEEAIRKMTSFPAQKFGLQDRGLLREGMTADIVIFDPEKIKEEATYDDPNQYPLGIYYVFVNGKLVIEEGEYKEIRSGKVLKF